ncbi:hypothetical protein GCM10007049_39380 [Echinicola pacifica]|uniref:Serine/threonine specific protein phosphatases domain-containing protein n=1 Tax=Echinicola pacifica TaxID=346377 RepID=A0A918QG36_9BACT|nr:metallophosphoesterase family protein [Echinicola pacifica]GGZ42422.1 hypothetical protein GCM10007049_39380 [Echinicola pacifica]
MQLFFIGDVHGCYHTFEALLEHWNPETEYLVQVGDLIDRGNFPVEVIRRVQEIQQKYPENASFIRGNHEQMLIDHLENGKIGGTWLFNGGQKTMDEFKKHDIDLDSLLPWLRNSPLKWENDHIFASHAGISKADCNVYDVHHPDGILWNRKKLKKIPKIQVIGHTPQADGKASFTTASQHWNVDTGAYRGFCLTGIKLRNNGDFLEEINIPTLEQDCTLR